MFIHNFESLAKMFAKSKLHSAFPPPHPKPLLFLIYAIYMKSLFAKTDNENFLKSSF